MRYLSVVDFAFPDRPSGSARVAWDIAGMMRERGHDVSLLCYQVQDLGRETVTEMHEGIRICRFRKPQYSTLRIDRFGKLGACAGRAAALLTRRNAVDVLHVHSPVLGLGVLSAVAATTRAVVTVHSPIVDEQIVNWAGHGLAGRVQLAIGGRILRRLEKRLLTSSAAVHVLSAYTRERLRHYHGAAVAEQCQLIPHWAKQSPSDGSSRTAARRALGWREDGIALFTLRNHRPRYGLDLALTAAAPLLEAHDAMLYIGGDGPLRTQLESTAGRLGVANRVRFLGRLTDSQVELAYRASDLFVLPTRALECFGLIILEALTHGCPVLGTDAGAIPEVLGPLLPGFIVPAGDVAAMRKSLEAFLRGELPSPQPALLRARLRERYAPARVEDQLLQLFERRDAA